MDFSRASILSPIDAEVAVRELKCFSVAEIGSPKWKNQREIIERLNMCSHSKAIQKEDDCVKALLVEHNALTIVLHELLVAEVFRQRLIPGLMNVIAKSPTAAYLYCNYESVLVNFLECICFYEEVILGFGDDILELIDYCWRQVSWMFSDSRIHEVSRVSTAERIKTETPLMNLQEQLYQQQITRGMSCLSILWFIIDHLNDLPMSAMNAILLKNDLPSGLCEVLLLQPWIRRSSTTQTKYVNHEFIEVAGDEVLRVCTPEAHTWFSLHHLLCDRDCRMRYTYTSYKKESILRIRRFLNEILLDQIPALESLQRALEELSFLEPPSGTEEKFRATLIIEQVPRLMASIDSPSTNWEKEKERMNQLICDKEETSLDALRLSRLFDDIFGST